MKCKSLFLILVLTVLSYYPGYANGTGWTTYDTTDGLAHNNVRAIAEDSQGNLWLGTYGGVSMFDGTNWTTYTQSPDGLARNSVYAVAEDSQGNIWFGTFGGGVSMYNGENWITYQASADGLANNRVFAIAEDSQGNMWFGTYGGGVSKFDGEHWTTYRDEDGLANNRIASIVEDSEGNLWFGTRGGVSRFNDTGWTTLTTSNGLAHDDVRAIAVDSQGNLWFGTYGGGVCMYGGSFPLNTYTKSDGLADNRVSSIAEDSQGNMWFGTRGGASMFNGTNWTTYKASPDGLAQNSVQAVLEDSEGNLWFGTYGKGVSKKPLPGPPGIILRCINTSGTPGSLVDVSIEMENSTAVGGGQFAIIPSPSDYVTFKGASTTVRTSNWTVSDNQSYWPFVQEGPEIILEYGKLIMLYSESGASIGVPETDPTLDPRFRPGLDILKIRYKINESAPPAFITLTLKDAVIADDNGNPFSEGNITLMEGTIEILGEGGMWCNNRTGDVNGDGLVNIVDAILIIRAALVSPNEPPVCTDINRDGKVTILDVVVAVHIAIALEKERFFSGKIKAIDKDEATSPLVPGIIPQGIYIIEFMDQEDNLTEVWIKTTAETVFMDEDDNRIILTKDSFGRYMPVLKGDCFNGNTYVHGESEQGPVEFEALWIKCGPPEDALLAGSGDNDRYNVDLEQLKTDLKTLGADPELISDIEELFSRQTVKPTLPRTFSLAQNAPNPFNPSTAISYTVPEGSPVNVSLKAYNIRGTLVRTLINEVREPGAYTVFWDGTNGAGRQVASGVYFYRMIAADFVQTRKMVLLK